VRLTVKDNRGASGSRSSTLVLTNANLPPVADLSVKCDEQRCTFDASSSRDADGTITSYQWSFDDGGNASGLAAVHVFGSAGNHSATLTVTDDRGAKRSRTRSFAINLPDEKPVAKFIYFCSGKTCQMNAGSNNDAEGKDLRYDWDFGDGAKGEGHLITHEFERSGNYTVKLMVVDAKNTSAVQSQNIKIKPPALSLTGYGNPRAIRSIATVLWSGAESETVDIYRDGRLVATTGNDGKFIDLELGANSKTVRYTLCESDSGRCSEDLILKLQLADQQMKIPAESAGISTFRSVQKGLVKFR
jgi:PKD repeat protein